VLTGKHYTYALGVTGLAELALRWRLVGAGLGWQQNWYDSIEGRDRHQETYTSPTGYYHEGVADDFNVREERRIWSMWLSLEPVEGLAVRASAEDWMRRGTAKSVSARRRDQRLGLALVAVF
jgi:hypothetical protein